jgi:hypothetical protein
MKSLDHFYVTFLRPVNLFVLAYFLALGIFYLALYVSAAFEMRRYLRQVRAERYREILSSEIAPAISMLVGLPASGDRCRRRRLN